MYSHPLFFCASLLMNVVILVRLWIAPTTLAKSSCHIQKGIERCSSLTVAKMRAAVSKGSLKDG